MPIRIVSIPEFLQLAAQHPVIDVRSPLEFSHAHIPGAHSLPLFTDTQRSRIGTAYKQESREAAVKIGLELFGPKMRSIIEEAEAILGVQKKMPHLPGTLLVHCARGGMRSAALAWLFDFYGFTVYQLEGGYKAYRGWVLHQFNQDYHVQILGGYTGSGKTAVLHALHSAGCLVLDLEHLANHKGSAFGGLGQGQQPSQEMFENKLAAELATIMMKALQVPVFLEDESQRIGSVNIPGELWSRLQSKPIVFLDIPFEARLDYLTIEYGSLSTEDLINAIIRIKKRLGPLETKTAINHLVEGDTRACFEVLLRYYDKQYNKAFQKRGTAPAMVCSISGYSVDASANAQSIIRYITDTYASC